MNKKIIIVGGVAGGASAAARLRRLSEEDRIIMFERDEYISFANCGLPYYIGDVIKDRSKLLVQTIEGMSKRFNLDIRNFSEVVKIDRENKKVTVKEVNSGKTYEESYDKVILSPGAKAIVPPIPGLNNANNIFTLRNIPDTDKIRSYVDNNNPKHAVIIGGGFIGIEMAENLVERGVKVTLVDLAKQVMAPLDYEMAAIAEQEMERHGVEILLEDSVTEFKNNGKKIVLRSGKEIDTDLSILAIGVKSENTLAKDAGLEIGPRGHIVTTKQLLTIDKETKEVCQDIYAVGDAIEVYDWIDNTKAAVPLAWPANRQGRLVADHINGQSIEYNGTLGSSVAKIFDITTASTGNNEKMLKAKGIEYTAVHIHRGNHAGYYPGASNITIKLIFCPKTGKIYGAQAVGREGTEKRIDVIATAIKGNLTVNDLPDIELCYAPPFSSAKDPVNIAGYVASNVFDGVYDMIQWYEIDEIVNEGGYVLDVRTELEHKLGTIKNAVNIPVDSIRSRLNEVKANKDKPVYVYCKAGLRAYLAIRILQENGWKKVYNLSGGYDTYSAALKLNKANVYQKSNDEQNEPKKVIIQDVDLNNVQAKVTIDACGLQCPGPIMQTYKAVESVAEGELVTISATDPGFAIDVEKWCSSTGNTLVNVKQDKGVYTAYIQKGDTEALPQKNKVSGENATIVLFSGDMDKALASMIIAQGAAAMGKKVTVFCTFWGLNLLRKEKAPKVKKTFVEKMFGRMMPKGPNKLELSKMNFAGMGPKMMKYAMKTKNVDSLDVLMGNALDAGVNIIACTMSMDVMGIKKEELIDGVGLGGVATYLAESEDAGLTLFI